MQPTDFKSISSGDTFSGEVPTPLVIPITKKMGESILATVAESAKPGDPNYDDVLEAWMFMHGYLGPHNS